MKNQIFLQLSLTAAAVFALPLTTSSAQTGTWNVDLAGNWSDSANWAGGIVADGAGNTANFSFDITAARTVTLDTSRTIGNIVFNDAGAATPESVWTIAGAPDTILTLENGGTTTITNNSVIGFGSGGIITAQVAGDDNLVFSSAATPTNSQRAITMNNPLNSYSGTTTVENGFLNVGANNIAVGSGPLGTSSSAIIVGNANTIANSTGGNGPNVGLDVFVGGANVTNYSIDRNIDSSAVADLTGRVNVRFASFTATAGGTLTLAGNWILGATTVKAYGLVAQQAGQTLSVTGVISGGATTRLRINDFGNGLGTIRLSNEVNSYLNETAVTSSRLLIGGNASATGPGALGANVSLRLAENGSTAVNVSALIDGAFTVGKTVNLDQGNSQGVITAGSTTAQTAAFTQTIGGTQAVDSSFTGNISSVGTTIGKTLAISQVAGGRVTLSGIIGPNSSATGVTNVDKVEAGTAVLTNDNTYDGITRVLGGILLANNTTGSATSTGQVIIGVVNPGVSGVAGSANANSTAALTNSRQINNIDTAIATNLVVGQTVSGVGIPEGATIASVNIGGGADGTSSIALSAPLATIPVGGSSNFELTFGAVSVTGTLGGTGRIAPAGTSGIRVNAGSQISSRDGIAESFEIDLVATTGNAEFLAGAVFEFELANPGVSDVIAFTGLSDSLVNFSNNTVNILDLGGMGVGSYTLFTFDQNSNYTLNSLVLGSRPAGVEGTFDYSVPGVISLNLTAVPEPTVIAGLLCAAAVFGVTRLRRKS